MGLLRRVATSLGLRSPVEAAGSGPRWGQGKRLRSPGREVTARREPAAQRAAWLVANDATANAIVAAWSSNLIGDGPALAARTSDAALRTALGERFDIWWSQSDAEVQSDFGAILRLVATSLVAAGEAFLILETDTVGELRLRSIAPEQVAGDLARNLANGGRITAGVETDAQGRRVAFWVRDAADLLSPFSLQPRRIGAASVIHVFDKQYAGQMRGITWLMPVITLLDQLSELQDSQLALANTASLYSGVLVNSTGTSNEEVAPASGLAPGALVELPVGLDVKFSSPPVLRDAHDFRKDILRSIAAGMSMPYEYVAGDLSDVNFSSARLGLFEFRRKVDAVRRTIIGPQLLDRVWRAWLAYEAMHGRVSPSVAARTGLSVNWPGWGSFDPKGETEADVLAVANGFASRAEIVARRGRDLRELDAEREADTFTPPATGGNKQ